MVCCPVLLEQCSAETYILWNDTGGWSRRDPGLQVASVSLLGSARETATPGLSQAALCTPVSVRSHCLLTGRETKEQCTAKQKALLVFLHLLWPFCVCLVERWVCGSHWDSGWGTWTRASRTSRRSETFTICGRQESDWWVLSFGSSKEEASFWGSRVMLGRHYAKKGKGWLSLKRLCGVYVLSTQESRVAMGYIERKPACTCITCPWFCVPVCPPLHLRGPHPPEWVVSSDFTEPWVWLCCHIHFLTLSWLYFWSWYSQYALPIASPFPRQDPLWAFEWAMQAGQKNFLLLSVQTCL